MELIIRQTAVTFVHPVSCYFSSEVLMWKHSVYHYISLQFDILRGLFWRLDKLLNTTLWGYEHWIMTNSRLDSCNNENNEEQW